MRSATVTPSSSTWAKAAASSRPAQAWLPVMPAVPRAPSSLAKAATMMPWSRSAVLERRGHLDGGDDAVGAVVGPGVDHRVEVAAGGEPAAGAAGPAAHEVGGGVDGDVEPGLGHPAGDQVAGGHVLGRPRLPCHPAARRGADPGQRLQSRQQPVAVDLHARDRCRAGVRRHPTHPIDNRHAPWLVVRQALASVVPGTWPRHLARRPTSRFPVPSHRLERP